MYSDTITLFNRYETREGTLLWFPHVLKNVDLVVNKASVMEKLGAENQDSAVLNIRYTPSESGPVVQGKPYLAPKEWHRKTNDELGEYITFNADANSFDFFILGEYPEDTIVDGDGTFFELMEEEVECYAIKSASNPYKLIPHFEILAG